MSRRHTITESKMTHLERFVVVVSWAVRKLRRFTTTASRIEVVCPDEEWVTVVASAEVHLRIRAMLVELEVYNCTWVVGENPWEMGGGVVHSP